MSRAPFSKNALARYLSQAESALPNDRRAVADLLAGYNSVTAPSIRIGISGSPGVGKSTLIEALGLHAVREHQRRLAVLAVDPSSPLRGGSLLADKTRMLELSRLEEVFIRPVPSNQHLGGASRATRESMWLCEMAGFDTVMVETVGVGQSEHEVARMVDFFIVLLPPGGGDELQGMKRGIMELADVVVVNKADGGQVDLAKDTAARYQRGMGVTKEAAPVFLCSALENQGIEPLWAFFAEQAQTLNETDEWQDKRSAQNFAWLEDLVRRELSARVDEAIASEQQNAIKAKVRSGDLSVHAAAITIIDNLLR